MPRIITMNLHALAETVKATLEQRGDVIRQINLDPKRATVTYIVADEQATDAPRIASPFVN